MSSEGVVEMCLPPPHATAANDTRCNPGGQVCEPYGEMWQQLGGEAHLFESKRTIKYKLLGTRKQREAFELQRAAGAAVTDLDPSTSDRDARCARFDLKRVFEWLARRRATLPFITHATLSSPSSGAAAGSARASLAHSRLLRGKFTRRATHEAEAEASRYANAFASWLATSPSSSAAAAHRPLQYRSCALVGSGHDLNCGPARGAEIDAHDAVFRSNNAQHAVGEAGFEMFHHGRTTLGETLKRHYRISDKRGGTRTTFRVNCLFGGRAALPAVRDDAGGGNPLAEHETCVVAHSWLQQAWGREGFNNLRHPCCSQNLMRSSYNLSTLLSLEAKGARFAFFRAVHSADESLEAHLAGSGGNALHTALSLCERVDVYGTGLFAAGATADKVYAHAYDERVGLCLEPGSRVYEFGNTKGLNGFFKWRRDRVRGELMMHLMHAVGIVRWVQ